MTDEERDRPHYTPPKPASSTRTQKHPSARPIVARKHPSGNGQPEASFRTIDEPESIYP